MKGLLKIMNISKSDYDRMMQKHANNLGRLYGKDVRLGNYTYIHSTDSLIQALRDQKADLDYCLRKEVKRDKFILNGQELEKRIYEICLQAIEDSAKSLTPTVAQEIRNDLLRLGVSVSNGSSTTPVIKQSSFSKDFGKLLGKSLTKGVGGLLKEIMNNNDR